MLGNKFKIASMNNLEEQKVSDETQGTNQQQNLSRHSQFLVQSPVTVPCEDQEGDDSKTRDSLLEPECLEQDNHPLSSVSESSSKESPEAELFFGSPVLDTGKKTDLQELVEFCRGGNYLGFFDNIIESHNPNNARSPSSGLQSVSEKENSGDLESDLDGIPASRISTTDGFLSSGCQSLHSDYIEKEQEHPDDLVNAGHSPCVISSPNSEILEMEAKYEMEEFCLSSHDDEASDEDGWENLKQKPSIGGGSPSTELESEDSSLSEKEQEHTDDLVNAGHSPCVISSPNSEILEMEAKYEMEEFCLSSHDDEASDEDGWENLKQKPSIGGGSPSSELESDDSSLSEKEQKERNEHLESASQQHVPLFASSEAANRSESQLLGMIKQLKVENKVEEEFGLSDSDNNDDGVDQEHILDSASNSKTSTPNRLASVGLGPVCSKPSEQEQEHKEDLTAAPVNDDRDVPSVAPCQAACRTAQFHHLPEKTDSVAKVESWTDLDASLEKNDEASQSTTGDNLLLTDSSSTCNESALEGRLSVTTTMKNENRGSEITVETSEFSESSEFSEFSESSTSATELSFYKGQQSALLKKLSSIVDSATFQELLHVIKAYTISLQKKKDHCQKLTAKFRQAEKENEKMNRLLKDSNYEFSYLKQMIRKLEVQYNVKVNKSINDESTYRSIKLENNELIFNSRNPQNLLQEQVCIQKEINEEKNSSMKDLQKQLAGLREELKLPHVYCNEEKAQQQNIEILKEKLEDTHHDLILNAMIMKDVCSYDNKMPTLKSDLAAMAACLENERKSNEMIKKELESTHLCLSEAKKEADLLQGKHRLENQRLKEELKESKDLSKKLATAVSHAKDKDNKVSRISKELKETTLQLEKLQCEKDQAVARSQELQMSLHQCREQLDQNSTYSEASKQKIQDLQEENNKLKTNYRRVQQELQQALHCISVNKGILENTIHIQKAMKQEKAELIKKLDKLKRELDSETKRANHHKDENEWLKLQLKAELLKNTKHQRKTWKLHNLTKSTREMLQDQTMNEAEMAEMKEMVSKLHTQLRKEKVLCSQLEIQSRHLQDKLDQQLMRNKMLKDELYLQKKRTEAELQTFQQQLQVEKRRLLSQSEAFDENQALEELKVQHEQALQKMKKELLMLTKSYKSSCDDAKRYQKLYNDETRQSMALASQLRMAQLQLQMSSYA